MRTTIELPEDQLRRVNALATLQGMKMKDLIADFVGEGLGGVPRQESQMIGMNFPIPVTIPATGRKISMLTNAQIFELLDREDDETHGRLP